MWISTYKALTRCALGAAIMWGGGSLSAMELPQRLIVKRSAAVDAITQLKELTVGWRCSAQGVRQEHALRALQGLAVVDVERDSDPVQVVQQLRASGTYEWVAPIGSPLIW